MLNHQLCDMGEVVKGPDPNRVYIKRRDAGVRESFDGRKYIQASIGTLFRATPKLKISKKQRVRMRRECARLAIGRS